MKLRSETVYPRAPRSVPLDKGNAGSGNEIGTFQVVSVSLQQIDVNDRGLVSICELRIYLHLYVKRKCSKWIKLAITNFQDSLGQKFERSPSRCPLSEKSLLLAFFPIYILHDDSISDLN